MPTLIETNMIYCLQKHTTSTACSYTQMKQ